MVNPINAMAFNLFCSASIVKYYGASTIKMTQGNNAGRGKKGKKESGSGNVLQKTPKKWFSNVERSKSPSRTALGSITRSVIHNNIVMYTMAEWHHETAAPTQL